MRQARTEFLLVSAFLKGVSSKGAIISSTRFRLNFSLIVNIHYIHSSKEGGYVIS